MKRITFVVAIMLLAVLVFAPAGFSEQQEIEYTVEATEAAMEIMARQGPELYVRMGTYRGIWGEPFSALVESDRRKEDVKYFSVTIEDMKLYIPEFLSFENNVIVIETAKNRGRDFVLLQNWTSENKYY